MRVGIMQPYFFPYVGYFSLIEYVEKFIFFDTPQYINRGWVNRNRVLKQDGTPNYITVPVKRASREIQIKDIEIADNVDWKETIIGKLSVYKRKAPNYEGVIEFIKDILYAPDYSNLSELNCKSIIRTCDYIGLKCDFEIFSKLDIKIEQINAPDEWALYITKALKGDVYVNPPGGQSFFDKEKYEKENIELQFLESNLRPYIQRIGHFVPGLSIIDVMMFCSKDEIGDILMDYRIVR